MRYVEIGDIRTSVLGFGCGSVMGRVGRTPSLRAMAAAWEAGVNLFDTARSYGYGDAEGLLGDFLAGKREQAVVVTKFGILPGRKSVWKQWAKPVVRAALTVIPGARKLVRGAIAGEMSSGHFDVATMQASLTQSLRQLRTEYVDVLLLHLPPVTALAQDDLIAALLDARSAGKVRRLGISSDDPAVLQQACGRGLSLTVDVLQFPWPALGAPEVRCSAWPNDGRLWLANHPFGGAARAAEAAQRVETLSANCMVSPALREKLRGAARQAVAEIVFASVFGASGAQAVVTSMLRPEHVRANVAAITAPRLNAEEIAELRMILAL